MSGQTKRSGAGHVRAFCSVLHTCPVLNLVLFALIFFSPNTAGDSVSAFLSRLKTPQTITLVIRTLRFTKASRLVAV